MVAVGGDPRDAGAERRRHERIAVRLRDRHGHRGERLRSGVQVAIVIGGGNANLRKELPNKCRLGDNARAFDGGFTIWQQRQRGGQAADATAGHQHGQRSLR